MARIIGHDVLALQSRYFNVGNASRYFRKGRATGNLDFTFGTSLSKVRTLLLNLKPRIHRVHILDTTCVRNNKCGSYSPLKSYTVSSLNRAILKRDEKILSFLKRRVLLYKALQEELKALGQNTKIIVSPALEHQLSINAWNILADEVKKVWPHVQLVNNPLNFNDGRRYRNCWMESHGNNPHPCEISSLDGKDIDNIDEEEWLRRTKNNKVTLVWTDCYNCRVFPGPFTDPRVRKDCPTEEEFKEYGKIREIS